MPGEVQVALSTPGNTWLHGTGRPDPPPSRRRAAPGPRSPASECFESRNSDDAKRREQPGTLDKSDEHGSDTQIELRADS